VEEPRKPIFNEVLTQSVHTAECKEMHHLHLEDYNAG
jgi:hypothetical protein